MAALFLVGGIIAVLDERFVGMLAMYGFGPAIGFTIAAYQSARPPALKGEIRLREGALELDAPSLPSMSIPWQRIHSVRRRKANRLVVLDLVFWNADDVVRGEKPSIARTLAQKQKLGQPLVTLDPGQFGVDVLVLERELMRRLIDARPDSEQPELEAEAGTERRFEPELDTI